MNSSKDTINQYFMHMETKILQEAVTRAYLALRQSILETEMHPDDEFYEMKEMHFNEEYDLALEALIRARIEEEKRRELSGELPF